MALRPRQHRALARLEVTEDISARLGCSIGSGIGGIGQIEKNSDIIRAFGPRKVSPFFVPGSIINMISGNLSVKYNLRGPNLAVVTACTSGTHNIGLGARLIAQGDADAMLVGGAEMATTPVGLGGFAAAREIYIDIGIREGAKLVCGGRKLKEGEYRKGFFTEPTLFESTHGLRITKEEIFGPVLSVIKVGSYEEAVHVAKGFSFNSTSCYVL